jgi:hypothetical protein
MPKARDKVMVTTFADFRRKDCLWIFLKISMYVHTGAAPVAQRQGDQIGLIFAQWAIVFFGQCFENYRSSANFLATLFHGASYVLILTIQWLGFN